MSYVLSMIVGNLAWPQPVTTRHLLANYWLIQTLNTGDCLYNMSMEMLYFLNCNSKLTISVIQKI